MSERWRVVDQFPDHEVSDIGRLRRTSTGRLLSTRRQTKDGYVEVRLRKNGHDHPRSLHGLVSRAFIGARPDGMEVNHRDGIKVNCAATNLEYVTHAQNMAHAVAMPHFLTSRARGERHGNAKLTVADVRRIKSLLSSGALPSAVAPQFGVTTGAICFIAEGVTWRHVTE